VAPAIVASPRPLRGVYHPRSALGAAARSRAVAFRRLREHSPRLRPGCGRAGCAAACSRAGPPRGGGSHSSGGSR
jgi:hypothetical protein